MGGTVKDSEVRLRVGNGECTLRLLWDKAPHLCREFEALLPITSFLTHAKFAGDELFFMVPRLWPAENLVSEVRPGDVGYYPDRQTVCIFYGNIVPFGEVGVFARVLERLRHLQSVGPQIWRSGPTPVHLERGRSL